MAARLVIGPAAYVLSHLRGGEWVDLATLADGAAALLPPGRQADEAGLEFAIEAAEDWLMPHARVLQGEELAVADGTGRLAAGLTAVLGVGRREWDLDGVEEMFRRLVDIATRRHRAFPRDQHG